MIKVIDKKYKISFGRRSLCVSNQLSQSELWKPLTDLKYLQSCICYVSVTTRIFKNSFKNTYNFSTFRISASLAASNSFSLIMSNLDKKYDILLRLNIYELIK